MYLSKYPKRRWTKKPQKSLGRVVHVHSRSARPLPLSQRRDLLTLTKWFPPLKSNFLSPFEPSLEKSPLPSCSLVVRVHAAIFIKGKLFEALNTRLSHPLPLLPLAGKRENRLSTERESFVSPRRNSPVPTPFVSASIFASPRAEMDRSRRI